MKKLLILSFVCLTSIVLNAQNTSEPFRAYLINNEYDVFLKIDFYKQNITVPGQDIYGELTGYFGSKRDGRLWLIPEMERISDNKIEVNVINDYGSEDFTATLTEDENRVITMKHLKGSTFKIVVDRKYVKIPKEIKLKWMKDK